jgi:hypothetical protein
MHKRLLLLALLACCPLAAMATPMVYHVAVDTSSISGTTGSIDFNFNPGPLTSQAASVQIENFTSGGSTSGSPVTTGDASGTLPGTLTLDNGTPFNDFFTAFTFDSAMDFDISLFGPALSSPDGTSTSGSTFAFSLFSDAAGTQPVLTSDTVNGFGYTIDVNLDGSTTATNFLTNGSTQGAVPEPDSLLLAIFGVGAGAAQLLGRSLRRR